jgi:hypothetical protein
MSANLVTISNASEIINAQPLPVVVLDTCVILDIIRSLERNQLDSIRAVDELIKAASPVSRCVYLIITEIVLKEWNENSQNIKLLCDKWLNKTKEEIKTINKCNNYLTSSRLSLINLKNFIPSDISSVLLAKAQGLVDSAIVLCNDSNSSLEAHRRAINNIRPSRKGQQSKDCDIIEHVYSLSTELRNKGFREKIIFTTSNTKDYYQEGKIHTVLENEFKDLNMDIATNLGWAKSLAKI